LDSPIEDGRFAGWAFGKPTLDHRNYVGVAGRRVRRVVEGE